MGAGATAAGGDQRPVEVARSPWPNRPDAGTACCGDGGTQHPDDIRGTSYLRTAVVVA
jgi:hypothetical protein